MKVFFAILLAGAVTLGVPGVGAAQDRAPSSVFGVAVKVGTLGIGVDAAVPVGARANIRAGFSALTLNHDFDNDGIDLAASLRLRSGAPRWTGSPSAAAFTSALASCSTTATR
jgi:hypothetical protein